MEIIERTKKVAKNKSNIESVIGIDTDREIISLYTINGSDKSSINYLMSGYKAKPFSSEFYDKLGAVLGQFREDHPNNPMQKVTIVLPDNTVLTDMETCPALTRRRLTPLSLRRCRISTATALTSSSTVFSLTSQSRWLHMPLPR